MHTPTPALAQQEVANLKCEAFVRHSDLVFIYLGMLVITNTISITVLMDSRSTHHRVRQGQHYDPGISVDRTVFYINT